MKDEGLSAEAGIDGAVRRVSAVDAVILWLWLAAVAQAPIWFGANTPLIWGLHAVVFGVLLAGFGVWCMITSRSLANVVRRLLIPLTALALVALWAATQSAAVVPSAWRNPIWTSASSALGRDIGGTISVFPEAGPVAILWMATVAAVFFLAHEFGRTSKQARLVLYVVSLSGGAIAACGLLVFASGNEWVLWRPKQAYLDALTATFINRNTFAAYAGMILTVTFGLMLDIFGRWGLQSTSGGTFCLLLLVIAFTIVSSALVLAGSRAGTAVTVVGISAVAILEGAQARRRYHRRVVFGAFAAGALAILGSVVVFGNFLASRMMHFDQDFSGRLALDRSVLAAIKASPWLGYGLGTFEQAYPPFRASDLQQSGRWEYAHNSWLEALMTLGIPVGLLVWLIFGWILARCLIGALRRGQDAIYSAIGAGVMMIAVIQSLIDFPVQIQGFAIPFLAILGVAVAQSWPRSAD